MYIAVGNYCSVAVAAALPGDHQSHTNHVDLEYHQCDCLCLSNHYAAAPRKECFDIGIHC